MGLFGRFRWIITPGNDLFIVHSYNWQNRYVDDPGDLVLGGDGFDPDLTNT